MVTVIWHRGQSELRSAGLTGKGKLTAPVWCSLRGVETRMQCILYWEEVYINC